MKFFGKCLACLSAAAGCLTLLAPTVFARESDPVYYRHDNGKMMIALTFDDGPHPTLTPEILDILGDYGIRATFFTVGENAVNYPDTIRRCLDEGHEIANHTYTHVDLSGYSLGDVCREIGGAEDALYEALEIRTKLFRPPGGAYGENVIRAAAKLDYTLVLWTVDTRDWAHTPSEDIAEKVLSTVRSGDIVLMHDYIGKNSPTPDALRKMIPVLMERGYNFVTVSELLGSE